MKEQISGTSVCDVSCLKLFNGQGCNLIVYFAAFLESGNLILLMSQKSSISCFRPINLQITDALSFHTFLNPNNSLVCSTKPVVLKLGSTEPQGFGEAVAGVRLRSE